MAKAKTLTNEQFAHVLGYVARESRQPFRDCTILLLSFRAGLRVSEIAGLSWSDVTDAFGAVHPGILTVPSEIAKKGSGRMLPMHPELHEALTMLKEVMGPEFTRPADPVIRGSLRNGSYRMRPNSLQRYISRTYAHLGLSGCSSHSGRRTFITTLSRRANDFGCSLRDVQHLAGHKFIDTTEGYIEPSTRVGAMVESL
jgi:integrase/recombinase XerC